MSIQGYCVVSCGRCDCCQTFSEALTNHSFSTFLQVRLLSDPPTQSSLPPTATYDAIRTWQALRNDCKLNGDPVLQRLQLFTCIGAADSIINGRRIFTNQSDALQAANAAGLTANLSSPAYSLSVLAPTDAAFAAFLARNSASCSWLARLSRHCACIAQGWGVQTFTCSSEDRITVKAIQAFAVAH